MFLIHITKRGYSIPIYFFSLNTWVTWDGKCIFSSLLRLPNWVESSMVEYQATLNPVKHSCRLFNETGTSMGWKKGGLQKGPEHSGLLHLNPQHLFIILSCHSQIIYRYHRDYFFFLVHKKLSLSLANCSAIHPWWTSSDVYLFILPAVYLQI